MSEARRPDHPIDPMFTQRWSPRAFTGEPMPAAELMSILEAARWAPSASNLQPWRFVFAHAGTPGFDRLLEGLVPFNQDWARRASVLMAVISTRESKGKANRWAPFDTGAAWMSLALQADRLGWSAHGMGGFDEPRLRLTLALAEGFGLEAMVALGRRGDAAMLSEAMQQREAPSARRPLAELVADFGAGDAATLQG